MNSPWLTPFDPQVLGRLRGSISQHADGHTTILRPRRQPEITRRHFTYVTP